MRLSEAYAADPPLRLYINGARGESFAAVARRVGEIGGVPVPPDATDDEVLDIMSEAGVDAAIAAVEPYVAAAEAAADEAEGAVEDATDDMITQRVGLYELPLYGGKLDVMGDSIPNGSGGLYTTWPKWVVQRVGGTLSLRAVAGASIRYRVAYDVANTSVYTQAFSVPADATVVVIDAGINDGDATVPLATFDAVIIGANNSTDNTTVKGALNLIFAKIQELAPLARILVKLPYPYRERDPGTGWPLFATDAVEQQRRIAQAIRDVCENWGVRYVDTPRLSPFQNYVPAQQGVDGPVSADKLHPRTSGHKLFAPLMEFAIRQLLGYGTRPPIYKGTPIDYGLSEVITAGVGFTSVLQTDGRWLVTKTSATGVTGTGADYERAFTAPSKAADYRFTFEWLDYCDSLVGLQGSLGAAYPSIQNGFQTRLAQQDIGVYQGSTTGQGPIKLGEPYMFQRLAGHVSGDIIDAAGWLDFVGTRFPSGFVKQQGARMLVHLSTISPL